jgi:hypothetical protein
MQLLIDLLNEHYLPEDRVELLTLLDRYDISSTLEKLVAKLRQYLSQKANENPSAPLSAIGSLSSSTLTSINSKVSQIVEPVEKRRVQIAVSQLALRLLLAILKQFPDEAREIIRTVTTSLEDTSDVMGYDFKDIQQLMMLNDMMGLVDSISGKRQASEIFLKTSQTLPFLQWTGIAPLDLLTHELHYRKWIKSRKEFEGLFENQDPNFRLRWDFDRKAHLAYLLFKLKEERLITQNGGKGYFSIVEKHVVDFYGQPLKANYLKKTSSKINSEKENYPLIINEIDKIISKVRKPDKGLSSDYSGTIRNSPLPEANQ